MNLSNSPRSRRRKGYGVGDREEGKKGRGIGERGRGPFPFPFFPPPPPPLFAPATQAIYLSDLVTLEGDWDICTDAEDSLTIYESWLIWIRPGLGNWFIREGARWELFIAKET